MIGGQVGGIKGFQVSGFRSQMTEDRELRTHALKDYGGEER
jgi:hypothetical protein